MVNIFVTGGKEYLKRKFKQTGRDREKRSAPKRRKKKDRRARRDKGKSKEKTNKQRPLPIVQNNRIPLVALGDAIFSTSIKGTIFGLARWLPKLPKRAEFEGLLVTVPATEYMASKTCSNFSAATLENIKVNDDSLFGVLKYLVAKRRQYIKEYSLYIVDCNIKK